MLTTNKSFIQWASIFNNDRTIASAALDRLLHHAEAIIIEGSAQWKCPRASPPEVHSPDHVIHRCKLTLATT